MTYSSPLLSRHGAVEAGGLDAGTASHYGDPLREQRALARGTAVVDLSFRGVVTVSGPDRLSWLNTLSSQQVADLQPGVSSELLLLSVQGRIDYDARIIDDGSTAWLLVESAEAPGLTEWLNRMKFMLRVDIADVTDQWAVAGATTEVPQWEQYLRWTDPWPHIGPGGFAYTAVPEDAHPGLERPWFEYLIPRAGFADAIEASGRTLAGSMASEALRIAAWRPRLGAETDEKTIPHELDLIRTAVHLAKGCYKGQETVARVHNLGHPPRRLVFLQLDGSQHTLPAAGSPVMLGERQVGTLTSVGAHYEMGPVGLAVVKRSVDPSVQLVVVDDGEPYAAAQEPIVAPDAGAVVGRASGFLKTPRR
ncbi:MULTISPECIES: folate-binding protein [unclassified Arthrobacter]|uniref:CAF17-like 4Fe-4S cluster assembly/insertion protein YgfZ n=1 Tax=unclassified Arthrobacter TaxID=235627 RepID=UPI001E5FA3DD|nr:MULTISPECIES: folate-binding protein [unclassified Arthrobacter]MCC9144855.1 folate-binding protein [Arthrobacter sp. zg-Y919]MDK1276081.1 folate-binding protein [Arthrobacter sp. zg.Y919]MDM7990054.1 folate-binding protein [Arthrobacter sp. zg-Y877]WIB02577.1 folate-binding protein [Arthrobacter sp. zg-Y919]